MQSVKANCAAQKAQIERHLNFRHRQPSQTISVCIPVNVNGSEHQDTAITSDDCNYANDEFT